MHQDDCPDCTALGAELCGPCAQEVRNEVGRWHARAFPLADERRVALDEGYVPLTMTRAEQLHGRAPVVQLRPC